MVSVWMAVMEKLCNCSGDPLEFGADAGRARRASCGLEGNDIAGKTLVF